MGKVGIATGIQLAGSLAWWISIIAIIFWLTQHWFLV